MTEPDDAPSPDRERECERLDAGRYVLLTTFRRDGRSVPTPVWLVRDGDSLLVWTVRDSGKVKRLRNRGDVLLAPCDVRGRPTGPETAGRAEVADDTTLERCRTLLVRKYGMAGRLGILGSRIRRGGRDRTVALRVRPC